MEIIKDTAIKKPIQPDEPIREILHLGGTPAVTWVQNNQ